MKTPMIIKNAAEMPKANVLDLVPFIAGLRSAKAAPKGKKNKAFVLTESAGGAGFLFGSAPGQFIRGVGKGLEKGGLPVPGKKIGKAGWIPLGLGAAYGSIKGVELMRKKLSKDL